MLDDLLELRTGDQVPADGVVRTTRTGSRSTSRCSPASRTRSSSSRATRCSRAAIVVAGSGRVPGDRGRRRRLRPQARRRGPPVHAHALRARRRASTTILQYVTWAILLVVGPLAVPAPVPGPERLAEALTGRGRRRRGDGARGSRAARRASRSVSPRSRSPAARCSCRSCPRSRGSPASTSCASTRPARSPRGSSSSTGSSRSTTPTQRSTDALAALGERRRRRQRDPGRDRRRVPGAVGCGSATGSVPFSSARKWSARQLRRPRHLGARRARDGVAGGRRRRPPARPTSSRRPGNRVLLLARADAPLAGEALPAASQPAALVLLEEQVRPDAAETLALLPRAGRDAQGHLGRQPAHGRRGRAAGRPARRGRARRRPRAARRRRRARRGPRDALGVRPGHAAAEAGDGQGAAVAWPRRRDDGRRRERRARAEGRRHRRRDGLRRGRDPGGRAARAARRRVLDHAGRRRRGPAGHRQHRAGRRTCSSPRPSTRCCSRSSIGDRRLAVPVPAPPPHDRQQRSPSASPAFFLALGAEHAALRAAASSTGCCASRSRPGVIVVPRWRSHRTRSRAAPRASPLVEAAHRGDDRAARRSGSTCS